MTDRPLPPDPTGAVPGRGSPPRVPRWLKVSGIVVGVLVLAVVAIMFVAGGHGPGQHAPGGEVPAEDGPGHGPVDH